MLECEGNDYVVSKDAHGKFAIPIRIALLDPKVHDLIIANAFSRLHKRHKKLNEYRVILGCNVIKINQMKLDGVGYKVNINENLIVGVYIYPNTPQEYINKLKSIPFIKDRIKII